MRIPIAIKSASGRAKQATGESLVNLYAEEAPFEGKSQFVVRGTPGATLFASVGFFYLTSRPYSIEAIEAVNSSFVEVLEVPVVLTVEAVDATGPTVTLGSLRDPLVTYEMLAEAIDSTGPTISDGELRVALIAYVYGLSEAADSTGPTITAGELRGALIDYTKYPPEAVDSSGPTITGGSLA